MNVYIWLGIPLGIVFFVSLSVLLAFLYQYFFNNDRKKKFSKHIHEREKILKHFKELLKELEEFEGSEGSSLYNQKIRNLFEEQERINAWLIKNI